MYYVRVCPYIDVYILFYDNIMVDGNNVRRFLLDLQTKKKKNP